MIGLNKTKCANFRASFSSYLQHKNRKKNPIHPTYLVSVTGGRLAEGKRSRDWLKIIQSVSCPFPSVSLPPQTYTRQVELIVCFSVFLFYIALKRGLPREFARFVLFSPIKKHSFNLLCVLDVRTCLLLVRLDFYILF